jgi:predicted lipoprotein with Yx(FWY)xxD motif
VTPNPESKEPSMPMRTPTASTHATPRPRPRGAVVLALATTLAVALAVFAVYAVPALARHSVHVHATHNAKLGKTIVVTASGRTLYTLSAEVHGRFICTGSCLSTWHPLKVPAGGKVGGVAHLGTIKRPDGSRQAAFKGRPLYTFDGDTKKGQVNGEGFRDVGTWHAAVVSSARHTSSSGSGGGLGY